MHRVVVALSVFRLTAVDSPLAHERCVALRYGPGRGSGITNVALWCGLGRGGGDCAQVRLSIKYMAVHVVILAAGMFVRRIECVTCVTFVRRIQCVTCGTFVRRIQCVTCGTFVRRVACVTRGICSTLTPLPMTRDVYIGEPTEAPVIAAHSATSVSTNRRRSLTSN